MKFFILYFNPIITIIYLIFALMTYLVLFNYYLNSRRNIHRQPTDNTRISPWKAFVDSRFFNPVLLIGSYLCLIVIPAAVRSVMTWMNPDKSNSLAAIITSVILSRLSYTIDAVIYIYLSKPVRNILLTRLSCRRHRDVSEPSTTEITMVTKNNSSGATNIHG